MKYINNLNSPKSVLLNSNQSLNSSSSKVLIKNAALVLTMDSTSNEDPLGIIKNSDVLIDKDVIVEVGKNIEVSNTRIIDATGKFVLPGFIDVHNHTWQSLIRGGGSNKNLLDWLEECVYAFKQIELSEDDVYAASRFSTFDLINSGITTVVDHSPCFTKDFANGNLQALLDSGLRFTFAYCGEKESFEYIREVKKTIIDPNPLADLQIGTYPDIKYLKIFTEQTEFAKELDVALNIHLYENIEQRMNKSFETIEMSGAIECKIIAAHAIHLTDEEIAKVAKYDIRIAHNPLSNMRLASGIMRLPKMKCSNIKIGIGLDGAANDNSDMFNTMKTAIGLQRAISLSPTVYPTVKDILRMATIEGAQLLDMDNMIGSLSSGKKADIIIINPDYYNFGLCWDWVSQIVFNGQPENVEYVFVNGKLLKEKKQVLGSNQTTISKSLYNSVERIKTILS